MDVLTEEPKKRDNIFDDVNGAARMIVANVLRRLICSQAEDYQKARAILERGFDDVWLRPQRIANGFNIVALDMLHLDTGRSPDYG